MAKFPIFKGSWPGPWPLIGSHCIPSCITHRPLPTYQISLKSKKLFVDERTDVRTGGRTTETHFIRLTRLGGVDLNLTNWPVSEAGCPHVRCCHAVSEWSSLSLWWSPWVVLLTSNQLHAKHADTYAHKHTNKHQSHGWRTCQRLASCKLWRSTR